MMDKPLRIYDVALDDWRSATQMDIDCLVHACTHYIALLDEMTDRMRSVRDEVGDANRARRRTVAR